MFKYNDIVMNNNMNATQKTFSFDGFNVPDSVFMTAPSNSQPPTVSDNSAKHNLMRTDSVQPKHIDAQTNDNQALSSNIPKNIITTTDPTKIEYISTEDGYLKFDMPASSSLTSTLKRHSRTRNRTHDDFNTLLQNEMDAFVSKHKTTTDNNVWCSEKGAEVQSMCSGSFVHRC